MSNFLLATALFSAALALGTRMASGVSADTVEGLNQLLGLMESLGPLVLLLVIFLNNAIKTLGAIVLGIALGLPPLVFIIVNGFVIGVLAAGLKSVAGYGVIVASMAPHGLIEVPILLLATALGFAVGRESLRWLTGRRSLVRSQLRQAIKVYLKWILIGLFVAAAIEVFVTPLFINWAGGGELIHGDLAP
ncbi:MAG TPA: hypothetical protein G4O03_04360 [Dehalococcoidia bacterium]|nr:hypothetical protein [Dehalococcoidia bacterium]